MRWLVPPMFVLLVAACGGGGDGATPIDFDASEGAATEAAGTEAVGAGIALEDRRPDLLAELGGPDAFVVTADEIDGTVVRFESWMYYEAATQIDLVDGEILWSVEIGPLPDGTLYPLWYDPAEFELLTSMEEVRSGLGDVELVEVALDDEAVPSGMFLAGDQLLLGFVDDQLVYVETFPLSPDEAES